MRDTPRTDAEESRQAAINDPSIRNYAAAWPELARTLERELAQARTVLEECHPYVKARLLWLQDNGQWDADDSVLTRIEAALNGGAS